MALIEVTLSPAWKRVVTDEDGTDGAPDEETGAHLSETADSTPEAPVETPPAEPDSSDEDSGRRLLTLRRVIALGVIVGAAVALGRLRSTVGRMTEDVAGSDASIDVSTGDDSDAESTGDTDTTASGDRDTMSTGDRDADR